MIRLLRDRILNVNYPYEDPIVRLRAASLLYMTAIVTVGWALFGITINLPDILNGTAQPLSIVANIATPFFLFSVYRLIQTGRANTAVVVFMGFLIVGVFPFAALNANIFQGFLLIIPLLGAGVLLDRRGFVIVFLIMLAGFIVRAVIYSQTDIATRFIPSVNGGQELILVLLLLIFAVVFLIGFTGSTERITRESFQDIQHLQTLSSLNLDQVNVDQDQLALQALRLIQNELGYNIAQIYFSDETGNITRRIRADGTIDTRFNARLSTLPVLGDVVTTKQTRVIRRGSNESSEYPTAPSRIGIVVPILYRELPLGVLDVQTRRTDEPTGVQLGAFTTLADNLGRALINARRLADYQRTVVNQEDVIASFRTRLTELQQQSTQVVGTGWSRFLEGRGRTALGFDMDRVDGKPTATAANDLPDHIRAAIGRGDVVVDRVGGEQIVYAPIVLRDEPLGAMTFTLPAATPITERQLDALRAVAGRLGQALENNRLFEQSQAQAQRERKANEVGAQLIGATNVQSLLEIAAQSFNDALGAVYTRIYIEPSGIVEPDAPGMRSSRLSATNGNGSHPHALGNGNGSNGAFNAASSTDNSGTHDNE